MDKRKGYTGLRDYYEHGVHYTPIVQLHDEIIYGAPPMETDEELRARLCYSLGPTDELARASGDKLDQLADRHRLARRQRGDFNYKAGRLVIGIDPGVEDSAIAMLYSHENVFKQIPKPPVFQRRYLGKPVAP